MMLLSRGWSKRLVGAIIGWFIGLGVFFLLVTVFPKIGNSILILFSHLLHDECGFGTSIIFTFLMTSMGSCIGVWCVGYSQVKKCLLKTFLFTFLGGLFGLVIGVMAASWIEFIRYTPLASTFECLFGIFWFLSLALLPPLSAIIGFELGLFLIKHKKEV